MTLLYIIPEYPSVSQTFVANEIGAMHALGVDVVSYALKRGSAAQSPADVELLCIPPSLRALTVAALTSASAFLLALWRDPRPWPSWREFRRLWLAFAHVRYVNHMIRKRSVTVAHVHAHFLGRSSDVANALAVRLGCQWTATAHGGDVYAPPEPALMRRRLNRVAAVACANRGVQTRLVELAAPATPRTELIHCGVNTRALRPKSSSNGVDEPNIVTVGRLVATKGYWTILDAVASLMDRHETLRWTIVGDGPLRDQLQQDERALRFGSRVTFMGALNHADVLDIVAKATLFVLPCEPGAHGWSDGIPVAIMEAMALGVVVVTTAVGGIAELVIPDETGFLVAPHASRQLAEVLERLLAPMPLEGLNRIRDAARSMIEVSFDLHREAAKLLTLLEPYGIRGASELD